MKKAFTLLIAGYLATLSLFSQTVTTVTNNLSNPLGLSLDGNDLYIGEWGSGRISKADITQPLPVQPSTVLNGLSSPTGILVIGNYLYFCAEQNLPGLTTAVGRIDLTQPNPVIEALTTNLDGSYILQGLAQDGNDLYISSSGSAPGIYKIDLALPFPQTATPVVINFPCSGMAIRGNEMYVGLFNGTELWKLDISQPNPVPVSILNGLAGPDGLVFNGNYLYLSEAVGTTIKRFDVTDPNPVVQNVVTGLAEPTYVAFDGVDLYFAQYAGAEVSRVILNQPVFSVIPVVCVNTVPNNLGGASPTGGVYSGPGVTNNGDGQTFTFDPVVAGGPGSYTITYVVGSGTVTSTLTVVPAPAVTFTPPSGIAEDAGLQPLNGSPAGGTYSGPGITGSDFDPAVAGVGTHTVTYTYSDVNGCSETIAGTIQVTFGVCPPGNVTLSTQTQVDQFILDYPNCTNIAGFLRIDGIGGTDITNLNGLANIATVQGYLRIVDNQFLPSLTGLNSLTQVGGLMTIGANAILTDVNGLSNLSSIGGWLAIQVNPQLQDLAGFGNLSQVGEDIYIVNNAVLSNISGLQNASFVPTNGSGLTIANNPMLSLCSLPNFCVYLVNDPLTHPRVINGNLGDCITEQAVQSACMLSLDNPDGIVITAFPNPVQDVLHINYEKGMTDVSVISMLGQVLVSQTVYSTTARLDISALPVGNYMVRVTFENGSKILKIVKQ